MSSTTKKPLTGVYAIPWGDKFLFERIDQGVDVSQNRPYVAIASGTVYAVTGGFAGGTGKAVYVRLDQPVTIDGHTYSEVYYAETAPLVKVGQHVNAGQPVAGGGAAELGFAKGAGPYAPLVGGLGAGTQPTQAGKDYLAFVDKLQSGSAVAVGPDLSSAASAASSAASAAAGGMFGGLEGWLSGIGKSVLAYLLLAGVAAGLFLTGLKGLGVKTPAPPRVLPV